MGTGSTARLLVTPCIVMNLEGTREREKLVSRRSSIESIFFGGQLHEGIVFLFFQWRKKLFSR
jgi:hypothetical protein